MLTSGWRCAVCGATTAIGDALTWRCPNATATDRRHAPQIVQPVAPVVSTGATNPFLAFRQYLAWDSFAEALGLDDGARVALVSELDAQVALVAGTGFVTTPFARADALSDELGFAPTGGVWVKNETAHVAGSQKARHLFGILLHLVTAERAGLVPWSDGERPSLAIASCGNAALAASTLAAAVQWPISVFVPADANPRVLERLHALGATVVECPRLPADPPGDPCVHRFREAVMEGAIPFSVQGTENAWCLDGGRTIGWEMRGRPFDRLFVQVGGGAFAACVSAGMGSLPRLHAVQTRACAPLERAWELAASVGGPAAVAQHWSDVMWPWEHVGHSAADGILDDETYDWLPVVDAMHRSHGGAVVASEDDVLMANEIGCRTTGIDASHTGTAGLAGLLAIRDHVAADERVAVIFSGVQR